MDKRNLKVEFRAVNYINDSDAHVLEWRISPNQDVRYQKIYKIFGFEIRRTVKCSTKWHQPSLFRCAVLSERHPENHWYNFGPVFVHTQKELSMWADKAKTYGELSDLFNDIETREREKYREERKKFLESQNTWNI